MSSGDVAMLVQTFMAIPAMRAKITDYIASEYGRLPELMKNRKRGYVSYLMRKDFDSLNSLNFSEIVKEMMEKFPDLIKILLAIMLPPRKQGNPEEVAEIVPRLALMYSCIMQARIPELSRFQRVMATCLADNICDQKVRLCI
jgi:hypothetical protein